MSDKKDPDTSIDLGEVKGHSTSGALPGTALDSESRGEINLEKRLAQTVDLIRSAKKLVSEGHLEDAKKALRHALRMDPRNVIALEKLEQIHRMEMKKLLGPARVSEDSPRPSPSVDSREVAGVIDRLSQDLKIDMSEPQMDVNVKVEPNLSSMRDELDLGVSLMEMGFYGKALSYFKRVLSRSESQEDENLQVGAAVLMGMVHLLQGQPLETVFGLEPFVRNEDISDDARKEVLYFLGRAYEELSRMDEARSMYQAVVNLDPRHRDVEYRVQALGEAKAEK